jgi:hypothetical protein
MTRYNQDFFHSLQVGLRDRVRAFPEREQECLARWSQEERTRRLTWYFLGIPALVVGFLFAFAVLIGLPLTLALPIALPGRVNIEVDFPLHEPVLFLAFCSACLAWMISWSQLLLVESGQSVTSEWYFPKKNRNRWLPCHVFWFAIPLSIFTVATWGSFGIREELSWPQWFIAAGLMVMQSLWIPALMGLWLGMVRSLYYLPIIALAGFSLLLAMLGAIHHGELDVGHVAWLLFQPTGWVSAMFHYGVLEGRPVASLFLVPVAFGFAVAFRWLRRGLIIHDIPLHGPDSMPWQVNVTYTFGMLKPPNGSARFPSWKRNLLWKLGKRERWPGEVHDQTERGDLRERDPAGEREESPSDFHFPRERLERHLSADDHGESWNRWDRWILTRFSVRQRHILRLVHGNWPLVSRATLKFAAFLGIWIFLIYLTRADLELAGEGFPVHLLYVVGSLFCCWFAWVPWIQRYAANARPTGLISSNLPIGYREWNRLNLRWTLLVLPSLLLTITLASWVLASLLEYSIWAILDLGIRPLLIFLIWTPFRSLSSISWPTRLGNEWQRFWRVGLPRILLLTWLVILTIPLAFIPAQREFPVVGAWPAVVLVAATTVLVVSMIIVHRYCARRLEQLEWDLN